MIPQNGLTPVGMPRAFLPPDNMDIPPTADWELGGIGLSNSSTGLEVQVWHLFVTGVDAGTQVWVEALNTPPTLMFSQPFITWARLAFDQNMHPVISFMGQNGVGYWWFDPTVPGQVFAFLPDTCRMPCVTMDDKRMIATLNGTNDVILAYFNGNNLCFRQERDRYGTEYILAINVDDFISNPFLNSVGMNEQYRLQFDIRGALYQ